MRVVGRCVAPFDAPVATRGGVVEMEVETADQGRQAAAAVGEGRDARGGAIICEHCQARTSYISHE